MTEEFVTIEVDGLPVEVTKEEADQEDIADRVRTARSELRLTDEVEAPDFDTLMSLVGDDDGVQ